LERTKFLHTLASTRYDGYDTRDYELLGAGKLNIMINNRLRTKKVVINNIL